MAPKKLKADLVKHLRRESGQSLIIVLVLLLIGSLTLPPILSHIGTALKSGEVYEPKVDRQYAADSGVEDAIWKIKYGGLQALFDDPDDGFYDFDTAWSYVLYGDVNGETTNVSIQNVWMPSNADPPDDPAEAREILEDENKLMVSGTGGAAEGDPYTIKIDFTPDTTARDNLTLTSVGVWLPYGFSYDGNCNLMDDPFAAYYPDSANVSSHCGGQAVVWTYSSPVSFTDFPDVVTSNATISAEVTFNYTASEAGTLPTGIAWVTTDKSGMIANLLPVTWDIDTRIFKIISVSGDTEIEAYSSKCELRNLNKAMSGDYKAIGNSLMQNNTADQYNVRDDLLASSSTTLDSIPNGGAGDDGEYGDVVAAYLYWSGYYNSSFTTILTYDDCADTDNWTQTGTAWQYTTTGDRRIYGHYNSEGAASRYLTWDYFYDLSGYDEGEVVVQWDQMDGETLEPTDGLTFDLSSNNGTTWSSNITAFYDDVSTSEVYFYYVIPQDYLKSQFKIRFHLEGCAESGERVYIDDFAIAEIVATADTGAEFYIDDVQVYLDDGEPAIGTEDVVATESQVLGFSRSEYAYACKLDVTQLVKEYAETVEDEYENDHHTGNADYKVGDVYGDPDQLRSYAGWSLIIVYSSPNTAGHLLKLYDTISLSAGNRNLDFDYDGVPGGDIGGFIVPEPIEDEENAATLTCFVGEGDLCYEEDFLAFNGTNLWDGTTTVDAWNSKSNSEGDPDNIWNSTSIGMTESGVDIDTFYVTWDSGLIGPDDTTAHIDLWTATDNYVLVYMILSMRAETTVGGTSSYVLH